MSVPALTCLSFQSNTIDDASILAAHYGQSRKRVTFKWNQGLIWGGMCIEAPVGVTKPGFMPDASFSSASHGYSRLQGAN
jgi:hypothetical protein